MQIRRMAAIFFAGMFATGLSLGLPQAAQAAIIPDSQWNEIFMPDNVSQSNTMCVDDPAGSTQIGQYLELWHCHGYASNGSPQRWQFIPVATDPNGLTAYAIRNTGSHLCLDIGIYLGKPPYPPSSISRTSVPLREARTEIFG